MRLIYPWIGCGSCAVCVRGEENLCAKTRFLGVYCDGGYSDHITVPHPKYLIEIDGLDPVNAAPYACSGVTTYGALLKLSRLMPLYADLTRVRAAAAGQHPHGALDRLGADPGL
jgi:D-arabinose 1-dehydrogenase-like Zn-dependent alcohol dehydrogenase